MTPELRDRLERAADESDPDAWSDLYHFFESARGSSDGLLDPDLVDAAAFGAAEGLFRAGVDSCQSKKAWLIQVLPGMLGRVRALLPDDPGQTRRARRSQP